MKSSLLYKILFLGTISISILNACIADAEPEPIAGSTLSADFFPYGEKEVSLFDTTVQKTQNCLGSNPTFTASMSQSVGDSVTWSVGGQGGVGVVIGQGVLPGGVNLNTLFLAEYGQTIDQQVQHGIAIQLQSPPGMEGQFIVDWYVERQPAHVDIKLKPDVIQRVDVKYPTRIYAEIQENGESQWPCEDDDNNSQVDTAATAEAIQATAEAESLATRNAQAATAQAEARERENQLNMQATETARSLEATPPTLVPTQTPSPDTILSNFQVFATTPENATNIIVNQGDTIYVEIVNGSWTPDKNDPNLPYGGGCTNRAWNDPFNRIYPVPVATWGDALIGYIGGVAFGIGCNAQSFEVGVTGSLSFGMNECADCYSDNDGSIFINVRVERR